MNNSLTLISYLPNEPGWFDRCGDFHPGTDSVLSIFHFTEKDSDKLIETMCDLKRGNSDIEFNLLINGIPEQSTEMFKQYENLYCDIYDSYYQKLESRNNETTNKGE